MKKPAMHKLKITIDLDRCGPAIGEALLMSVTPIGSAEFKYRQKRLRAALKKVVREIKDCGPVKKRKKA